MEHEIILDLLPLYHDGVCSDASRAAVEEHLKNCETCREALAEMDAPLPEAERKAADDAAAVKKISREWERDKWKARLKGAGIAVLLCMATAGCAWALNTWLVIPMDEQECSVRAYQLEDGDIGVHYTFVQATWYGVRYKEEPDGMHYYLERPILKTTAFNFDNKSYRDSGDMMLNPQRQMEEGVKALYFDLGEKSILLWKEGETVDLPAATAEEEARWSFSQTAQDTP